MKIRSSFYGRGKLLITGEYAVLDGAQALAIPTRKGQSLTVFESQEKGLLWTSQVIGNHTAWFEGRFGADGRLLDCSDTAIGKRLEQLLLACLALNPKFSQQLQASKVIAQLEFQRNWGLGSSSTLISTLSQWAKVNPYVLMENSFGKSGSGYDLACAETNRPILYQLSDSPRKKEIELNWPFQQNLLFIFMEEKQDSRRAIELYRQQNQRRSPEEQTAFINSISRLTQKCIDSDHLQAFENIITEHEEVLSDYLELPRVQTSRFGSYRQGVVKSLGAWGGDFVLASCKDLNEGEKYFKEEGYNTVLSAEQMLYPSLISKK